MLFGNTEAKSRGFLASTQKETGFSIFSYEPTLLEKQFQWFIKASPDSIPWTRVHSCSPG